MAGLGRIIAEAGKGMAGLKADLGRVAGALSELRESQRAGSQCGDRATVRRQRGGTTRVEGTAAQAAAPAYGVNAETRRRMPIIVPEN